MCAQILKKLLRKKRGWSGWNRPCRATSGLKKLPNFPLFLQLDTTSNGRRIFRPRATTSGDLSISHKSTPVISSRNRFIVGKPLGVGFWVEDSENLRFFIYTSFLYTCYKICYPKNQAISFWVLFTRSTLMKWRYWPWLFITRPRTSSVGFTGLNWYPIANHF